MAEQAQQQRRPTNEEIAKCSYLIWEKEGCPHGRDVNYWLRAEAELNGGRKSQSETSGNSDGARKKKSFA